MSGSSVSLFAGVLVGVPLIEDDQFLMLAGYHQDLPGLGVWALVPSSTRAIGLEIEKLGLRLLPRGVGASCASSA